MRTTLSATIRAVALTAVLLLLVLTTGQHNKTHQLTYKLTSIQMIIKSMYSSRAAVQGSTPCGWLKKYKRQYRLCKNDPGMAKILQSAKQLAVAHCEDQFRYNRWNCSRPKKYFRSVFRETALLYALASSALAFSVARACAEGKLYNCHCAKNPDPRADVIAWKWGLCSDNVRYGRKFARQFLQLNQRGDELQAILRHNSMVGVNLVGSRTRKNCKCQGLSGSCGLKVCFKRVEPFEKIAGDLHARYHSALLTQISNTVGKTAYWSDGGSNGTLRYLVKSPTFCKSTPGRRCQHSANCATLCCGRGYTTHSVLRNEKCKCKWRDACCGEVKCDNCTYYEDEYTCK